MSLVRKVENPVIPLFPLRYPKLIAEALSQGPGAYEVKARRGVSQKDADNAAKSFRERGYDAWAAENDPEPGKYTTYFLIDADE